ncbi:transposase [Halomonas sp. M5N1S17]|uniref:transposase n=1 Tax=Halomonas alkalisoli TaxID=2907158 RepID=UPI001F3F62D5|nr:transposase [Halomonas alkalisoli]MCE9663664.1 transposase [Halomonas alkalisoli]
MTDKSMALTVLLEKRIALRSVPNTAAVTQLVGAVLLEQADEWPVSRRYRSSAPVPKEPIKAGTDQLFHEEAT